MSAGVKRALDSSIDPSTRRSYESAQRDFLAWRSLRGLPPFPASPFTTGEVAEWLVHIAAEGGRAGRTIATYRSALSTLHATSAWGASPNPIDNPLIHRVVAGLQRQLAAADAQRRAAQPRADDVSPDLLAWLEPTARGDSPHDIMAWAAACVGAYSLARSSELVGSYIHPSRALRVDQVSFYASARERVGLLAPGRCIDDYELPDHAVIQLDVAKTAQLAPPPPIVLGARPAVAALWRWMHLRASLGATGPLLFQVPGRPALTMAALCSHLALKCAERGRTAQFTGKSFRRGGASAAVALGMPAADAAAAGRWAGPGMLPVYASADAKRIRAAAVNRALEPRL